MYIKLTNGVPEKYSIGRLRRDNPNVSFPKHIPDELLEAWDVYPYIEEAKPIFTPEYQRIVESGFEVDSNGNYTLTFSREGLSNEVAEANQRAKRDALLSATDWMALSDVVMSQDWIDYRQALRDITTHPQWPTINDDDWPVKPS